MNKGTWIDMFGLSGNPGNDEQLADLLARLESEEASNSLGANRVVTYHAFPGGGNCDALMHTPPAVEFKT
ncbi:MAG: hypothetical protein H0X43_10840 [Nitrosospira sp.]|nr:hypothetical protein [Nitrosospira sp.]